MRTYIKVQITFYAMILLYTITILPIASADEYSETIYPSAGISLLTTKPLTPGEPADVGLTIFYNKGESIIYPMGKNTFEPLKLIEVREKTRKIGRGKYKKLVIYTLTSYYPGKYTIPSLEIRVGKEIIETESLTIDYLSVLPKDNPSPELKEIKPIEKVRIFPYLLITITLTTAIGAGFWIILKKILPFNKSRKKTLPEIKKTPEIQFIDPLIWIENSLNALQEKIKSDLVNTKDCYTDISCIIRIFIEHVYSISAKHMTTTEIKKEMMNIQDRKDNFRELIKILSRSDLVKFARDEPARKVLEKDLWTISRIVSSYRREVLNTVS